MRCISGERDESGPPACGVPALPPGRTGSCTACRATRAGPLAGEGVAGVKLMCGHLNLYSHYYDHNHDHHTYECQGGKTGITKNYLDGASMPAGTGGVRPHDQPRYGRTDTEIDASVISRRPCPARRIKTAAPRTST